MKRILLSDLRRTSQWHQAIAAGKIVDGIALELPDDYPLATPAQPPGLRGLGDLVHAVAHPIAAAIDAATKHTAHPTRLATCGGCQKRRDQLNQAMPFPAPATPPSPPPNS